MSYVSVLTVVQNDYGYDLEFKITDSNGNPVDLTGATAIKLFVARRGSKSAKVVGDCSIVDAVDGVCKYVVKEGDFNEAPKEYEAEVEITYLDKTVTAKGLKILVQPELPETKQP